MATLDRIEAAVGEGGTFTPEQRAEYDRALEEARKADEEIAANRADLTGKWQGDSPAAGAHRPASGRKFREMFPQAVSDHGWRSPDEFLSTVHADLRDDRLRPAYLSGLQIGAVGQEKVGSDGGFSVPEVLSERWLDAALESEIVRPRASVWPMSSNIVKVPGWDGYNHSSTLFGGFGVNWSSEASTLTAETPTLRLMTLEARKLTLLTQVSNELLADSMSYEAQLSRALVSATSFHLDNAFLNGTGAGQPLGVMNSDCLVTIAKESAQVAATIVYANLVNMFARLHPASVSRSVWVAHPSTIPELTTLTVSDGTVGGHVPVMKDSDGSFTLLTRPVIFSEKMQTLGTAGDLLLADFSQYAVGLRSTATIEKSGHAGFSSDTSYYRLTWRVDGRPTWPSAITPLNGSNTLSPFVALATRA